MCKSAKEVDWKFILKQEFQSFLFTDVSSMFSLHPLQFDVKVFAATEEKHKWCIIPILPVNVLRS